MLRKLAVAAALMLAASAAFAQVNLPPGKWWRRPEVVRVLNLSPEQQDRLENVFRTSAPELIDLRADVEKQSIALRAALDTPQLDRSAIRQHAQQLSDARGRLFQRELMLLVDMRSVLTDQQWNRMRNELDRLPEKMQQRQEQRPRPKLR